MTETVTKGAAIHSLYAHPQPVGLCALREYLLTNTEEGKLLLLRFVKEGDFTVDSMTFEITMLDAMGGELGKLPVTLRDSEIPPWLSTLCGEMKKNGNFTYGIDRMLSLTDKSREHVSRSIKKYMGVTLSEFINDLRLHFIANMLKNSNHDIADIIFESGFGNISWAAELFRKKYGMTMSKYRKNR